MKQKLQRSLALFLSLLMLLGVLPMSVMAENIAAAEKSVTANQDTGDGLPFEDVSSEDWFYEAIKYVFGEGIFNGTSDDLFSPDGSMTRAMFVTALGRYAGVDTTQYPGNGSFSDVDENAYYAPYVSWAVEVGITKGVGDGRFDVNAPLTREQLFVFMYRFFTVFNISYGAVTVHTEPSDLDKVSDWAREAVLAFWSHGLIRGDGSGRVDPGTIATRAVAAQFFLNYSPYGGPGGSDPVTPVDPGTGTGSGGGTGTGGDNSQSDATYTLTFNSNGGGSFDPIKVKHGQTTTLPIPVKEGYVFVGWYSDEETSYTDNTEATASLTLSAQYLALSALKEEYLPDIFTLSDQQPGMSLQIVTDDTTLTAEQVKEMLSLDNVSNAELVLLNVTGGNGSFTVSAVDGFAEGASYELHLDSDALNFKGREASYRTCAFQIEKDEINNVQLNDGIIYIPAGQVQNKVINGAQVRALEVPVAGFAAEDGQADVTGSFTYSGSAQLAAGDVLCIYSGKDPSQPGYENNMDDEIAYVKVVSNNGNNISFTEVTGEEVISTPDTLPIQKNDMVGYQESGATGSFTLPDAEWGKMVTTYADIGLSNETVIDAGDIVVIYNSDSIYTVVEDDLVYGIISKVTSGSNGRKIDFKVVDAEDVMASSDYYATEDEIDLYDEIPKAEIRRLEAEIQAQALDSGFAEIASQQITAMVLETDSAQQLIDDYDIGVLSAEVNGEPMDAEDIKLMAKVGEVEIEDLKVVPKILAGTHFGKGGIRCALTITFEMKMDLGDGNELGVECSVTFIEEVNVKVSASGDAIWKKKWIFPYISDYKMSASLDFMSYTSFSFDATVALSEADDEEEEDDKDDGKDDDKKKKIKVKVEFDNLFQEDEDDELKEGVKDIFELYKEFMENDTDYVRIVTQPIYTFKMNLLLGVIQIKLGVNFVVSAKINAGLGCGFEYETGTRYCFWATIGSREMGSSTTQLVDETFKFQFYLIGEFGIRAGVEIELAVGLFSTDLASVGFTAEVGIYMELNGFFVYELQIINKKKTSNFQGAMYWELGAYFNMKFKAQALNKYSYTPTLVDKKWPLLKAGNLQYVHDFTYDDDANVNQVLLRNNTKTYNIPSAALNMSQMNMQRGEVSARSYPIGKFKVSVDNPKFKVTSGKLTVAPAAADKYLKTTMTITWTGGSLAFSKLPVQRSWTVVWTNMTDSQLKERHPVSVMVNGAAVWTKYFAVGEELTLPTKEEVLKLLGYSSFDVKIGSATTNLKYLEGTGYGTAAQSKYVSAPLNVDFNLPLREYTLNVSDVQNANGSKATKTFKAKYGEAFDLSSLAATGTEIQNTTFTRFYKIETYAGGTAKTGTADLNGKIGNALATELLNGSYTYKAIYEDNSCVAKVDFLAFEAAAPESVTQIVKKYSDPAIDYAAHVSSSSSDLMAYSIDKTMGPISQDTTFTVTCVPTSGYYITLHRNGGTYKSGYTASTTYTTDAAKALPTGENLTRTGYTFAGWYETANFSGSAVTEIPAGTHGSKQFYAKWTTDSYNITLVTNGGGYAEGYTVPTSYAYGKKVTLPNERQLLRDGYNFLGWYESSALLGEPVKELPVGTTGPKTFYAKWKVAAYPLTLDANGGAFEILSSPPDSYTAGVTLALPGAESVTRTHYSFAGWYDSLLPTATQVTEIDASATGAKIYYAHWTPESYPLTLEENGGVYAAGYQEPTTYAYGSELTLPTEAQLSKTSHRFLGWYDNEALNGDPVRTMPASAAEGKTYYAKWELVTYALTLDANGGSFSSEYPAPESYTAGVGLTLPDDKIVTRVGHSLKGWYDGLLSTANKVEEISASDTGAKTLYAHWTPNSYSLTLVTNGGVYAEGYPEPTVYYYGTGAVLPNDREITKGEDSLLGWYDNADLTGTPVTRVSATDLGDKTYYAKWGFKTSFTVRFHENGGWFRTSPPTSYEYGTGLTLPGADDIGREGYTFGGWFLSEDLSGTKVDEIIATELGDKEFYAKWLPANTPITLEANEGTYIDGYTAPTAYTTGTTLTLPDASQIKKEGYTFGGWYRTDFFGGSKVAEITSYEEVRFESAFYAKWISNELTLSFNANGGSGSMEDAAITLGVATTLPENGFTNGSLAFVGWTLDAVGSGTIYENEATATFTTSDLAEGETLTLYAQWANVSLQRGGDTRATSLGAALNDIAQNGAATITPLESLTIQSAYALPNGTSIDGDNLTLTRTGSGGVFTVEAGATVSIVNLNITGAKGTAIRNAGELTMDAVRITSCGDKSSSSDYGGALNNTGTATLTNCALDNCVAKAGGAVFNAGTLLLRDSSITNASTGSYGGGAIESDKGVIYIINSTIACNSSGETGGAINLSGTAYLINSTIAGNVSTHATYGGGGIGVKHDLVAVNTIFANNYHKEGGSFALNDLDFPFDANASNVSLYHCAAIALPVPLSNQSLEDVKGVALADSGEFANYEMTNGLSLPVLTDLSNGTKAAKLNAASAARTGGCNAYVNDANIDNIGIGYYDKEANAIVALLGEVTAADLVDTFQDGTTRTTGVIGAID